MKKIYGFKRDGAMRDTLHIKNICRKKRRPGKSYEGSAAVYRRWVREKNPSYPHYSSIEKHKQTGTVWFDKREIHKYSSF